MAEPVRTRRIIVAISGASGAVYGARLLQVLRGLPGIETHLVVSDAGWRNLQHELGMERPAAQALAHQVHDVNNVGAAIASGSFQCHAMVVAPFCIISAAKISLACSMLKPPPKAAPDCKISPRALCLVNFLTSF